MIDFTGEGVVAAPLDAVTRVVADLGTYPQWLGIVLSAVPDGSDGPEPAWVVEIGGRLGPFTRSKRLRMVRTADGFERAERDGRPHSPWHLAFSTSPADVENGEQEAGTKVVMRLRYGGGLPLPGVDRLLAQEVRRALPRLEALALDQSAR